MGYARLHRSNQKHMQDLRLEENLLGGGNCKSSPAGSLLSLVSVKAGTGCTQDCNRLCARLTIINLHVNWVWNRAWARPGHRIY